MSRLSKGVSISRSGHCRAFVRETEITMTIKSTHLRTIDAGGARHQSSQCRPGVLIACHVKLVTASREN